METVLSADGYPASRHNPSVGMMTDVLEPGTTSGAAMQPRTQADLLAEASECSPNHASYKARSALRNEERLRFTARQYRIAERGVGQ